MQLILIILSFFSLLISEFVVILLKNASPLVQKLNHGHISGLIFFEKICLVGLGIYFVSRNRSSFSGVRFLLNNFLMTLVLFLIVFKYIEMQKFYVEKMAEENLFQRGLNRVEIGYKYGFLPGKHFNKQEIARVTEGKLVGRLFNGIFFFGLGLWK